MQYVLGLGIGVEKYKLSPNFRVFLNDILIDEFTLDSNDIQRITNPAEKQKWGALDRGIPGDVYDPNVFLSYPSFLKIYSVPETTGTLKIQVMNNDSNYTNGFLTRSTIVRFHTVFYIPKKCYDNNFEYFYTKRIRKFEKNLKKRYIQQKRFIDNHPHSTKDWSQSLQLKTTLPEIEIAPQLRWPLIMGGVWHKQFPINDEIANQWASFDDHSNAFEQYDSKKNTITSVNLCNHHLGGHGTWQVNLIKKYGTIFGYIDGMQTYGNILHNIDEFAVILQKFKYNKYTYENQ